MVISSSPQPPPPAALIPFLRHQLGLSESALELGIRQSRVEQAPLAVVLWRFGLISLEQYIQVLDWQDGRP
jgi:hypothetical protein